MFKNKKILFFSLLAIVLSVFIGAHFAQAQSSFGLETGLNTGLGTRDLKELIASIVKIILGFLGIVAVIILMYGGFIWMTAAGEADKVEKGKKIVVQMVIGLVIILSSYLIVSYVLKVFQGATGGTGDDGGGGGGGGGGGNNAFRVVAIEPQGNLQFRNIPVQISFNKDINPDSLTNNAVAVAKMNEAGQFDAVAGTLRLDQNLSRLIFIPEALCPEPNNNLHCFDYNAENISLNIHRITVISDPLNSVKSINGETVTCLGNSCTARFSTGANITERPLYCYNGIIDEGETGIDCGGECGACSGDRCSTQANACTPDNTVCASNICNNECVCLVNPIITALDPDNGAIGNLITISGRYFGATAGRVMIDETQASLPNNEQCSNSWLDNQIIIVVPEGLSLGNHQVKIITQAGLESNLQDFLVNETIRPGLCNANPAAGVFEDRFTLSGIQFGANNDQRDVVFGQNASALNPVWDAGSVVAGVPNLQAGDTSVRVKVNNEFSNPLRFRVNESEANRTSISYFTPTAGNSGQYVTIFGRNFGNYVAGQSLVKFSTDKEGSFAFPNECSTAFWTNNQIIVKVPNVDEVGALDDGPITVITANGQTVVSADNFDFNDQLEVSPGVCSVLPRQVARGGNIEVAGENFNQSSLYLNELLLSDEPANNNNFSLVAIPNEANTGQITVRKNNLTSNPIALEISAPGGRRDNVASYYQWQFTTCANCVKPEVLKNLTCREGQIASPTPLPNTRENFAGSLISASFNTSMKEADFELNRTVIIKQCGNGAVPQNCQNINAAGAFQFYNTQNGNLFYFTLDLNNDLNNNTWYQVILSGSISSSRLLGNNEEENIPLGEDFGDGSYGDQAGDGWYFKTKEQNQGSCSGNAVAVSPRYRLEAQGNPVFLGDNVNYASQIYNSDNCNICPNNFSWSWSSSQERAAVLETAENDPHPNDNQKLVRALALTNQTARITATATDAPNTPSGSAELDIVDSDPMVVIQNQCVNNPPASPVPYPNYQEACVNAVLAVKFDHLMDPETLIARNFVLTDADGNILTGTTELISGQINNHNGIIGFKFIPQNNLNSNSVYRVNLTAENIKSATNRSLQGLSAWNFKTRDSNELCVFSEIFVEPDSWRFTRPTEQKDYTGQGQGNDCQLLKAVNGIQWSWTSETPQIASISAHNSNQATVQANTEGTTFIRASTQNLVNQGNNGKAIVDYSGLPQELILQSGLPRGNDVCLNAQGQIHFNLGLIEASVTQDTLKLFKDNAGTWEEIGYRKNLALNNSVINLLPQNNALWEPLTNFEIRVYGGGHGIVSNQESLFNQSGCGENYSWNDQGEYCYWRFHTTERQCAVATLNIEPRIASTTVGSFLEYLATPKAQNGDPLSNTIENWGTSHVLVATVATTTEDGHEARVTGAEAGETEIVVSLHDVPGGQTLIRGIGNLTVLPEERGPEIILAEPNGNRVCRNSLVSLIFDRQLKEETVNNNVKLQYRQVSDQDLTANGCSVQLVVKNNNLFVKFASNILGSFFGDLIASVYQQSVDWLFNKATAAVYWCPITTGSWNFKDLGRGASLDFNLTDLLPSSTPIRIMVQGGEAGIKGINNLPLVGQVDANQQWLHAFTTQSVRCDISYVNVLADQQNSKAEWTFNTSFDNQADNDPATEAFDTANDSDKLFIAGAFSAQGTELSPIPNVYDWEWQWATTDASIAVIGTSTAESAIIEAQNKNGQSFIAASAVFEQANNNKSGNGLAIVDICLNRWNPTRANVPSYKFIDQAFNFSLSYCMDFGVDGPDEDLPELAVPQTVPVRSPALNEDSILPADNPSEYLISVPGTGDVIGIRVFSNNSHYTPSTWYQKNLETKGSPQPLIVDGYQAIKDGRSVYVAASSVVPQGMAFNGNQSPLANLNLWQKAGSMLLPKIFAANLPNNNNNQAGDINQNQQNNFRENNYDAINNGLTFGMANQPYVVNNITSGWTDIYLLSYNQNADSKTEEIVKRLLENWRFNANVDNPDLNQKIRRDVQRLADFQAMSANLDRYYTSHNNTYPALTGGTYLNGISTSKWPSWQQTLSAEIGGLPSDPINNFNACIQCDREDNCGFDPNTCWNAAAENGHGSFACDGGSYFYLYRAFNNVQGSPDYTLAAKMETTADWRGINNTHWALSTESVTDNRAPVAFGCTQQEFGAFCGDGVVNQGEDCEPGMSKNWCSNDKRWYAPLVTGCIAEGDDACTWADPFAAGGIAEGLSRDNACGGWCGDTILNNIEQRSVIEQCDASVRGDNKGFGNGENQDNQYLCSGTCQDTGGWCGDTRVQSNFGEICDLYSGLNGYDCVNPNATVSCAGDCKRVRCSDDTTPYKGQCGNNVIEGAEQCDGTNVPPYTVCNNCVASCAQNRGNCDNNYLTNGCEINLLNDPNFCGACNISCYTNFTQVARNNTNISCNGTCAYSCPNNLANCDNNLPTNGCEINTNTDAANCGVCGVSCHPAHSASGRCVDSTCNVTCATNYIYNPQTNTCDYSCGDGALNGGEQCDGNLFNNRTCRDYGYAGGNLSCGAANAQNACTIDAAGCCSSANFSVSFTADNYFQLWINGQAIFTDLTDVNHPTALFTNDGDGNVNAHNGVVASTIIANGEFVWKRLYSFSSNLQQGDNVIAVRANDSGSAYGLIGKFDCGGAGSGIVTLAGNNSKWKCVSGAEPNNDANGRNWKEASFDDTAWQTPDAVADNNTWTTAWKNAVSGAQVIWKGNGNNNIWCRYKTNY